MHMRHKVAATAATLMVGSLLALLPSTPAISHGTLSNPPSRVYVCKNENPENPTSAACKAAVAAGGTQAFYDWNEVSGSTRAGSTVRSSRTASCAAPGVTSIAGSTSPGPTGPPRGSPRDR